MKKRTILIVLAVAAVLVCIGADQVVKIDIPYKAARQFTVSVMFSDNPGYPYKKEWTVFNEITKATNVKLDVMVVPMSEYNNKRNLLVASGDAPMIMPKTYPGSEVPYIPSGQILPISQYTARMPNYTASVKAWNLADDLKTITQKDGNYYVLPGLHQSFTQDYSLAIRTDIFKKAGIPIPDTWTDVENALLKLKQLYPDVTPWSDRWGLGSIVNIAGPAFGMGPTGIKTPGADWNNGSTFYFDKAADKFIFYPTSPLYKEMLSFFARLVREGVLDPESATQTDDQAVAKFENGKSFMISCNAQAVNGHRTKMDQILGKGNYEIARINVPAGPAGGNLAGNRLENGIIFNSKIKTNANFDGILKFVDWLWYSYAGQELTKWGIKGKTFVVENGVYGPAPGYKFSAYGFNGKASTDIDIRNEFGFGSGVFILSYGGPDPLAFSTMTQENRDFTALVARTRKVLPPAPPILYSDEELEVQNMIKQPIMDYVFQMTYKFILGQEDISTGWDNYVKQCEQKGSAKYTNLANRVYQDSKKR